MTIDFNSDAFDDLFWRNKATGDNGIWTMGAEDIGFAFGGSFGISAEPNTDWYVGGVNDIDGNEAPDLLWRNQRTGENGFWLLDGAGITVTTTATFESQDNTDWVLASSNDINQDGEIDLLWRNQRTGENGLWLMDYDPTTGAYDRTDTIVVESQPNSQWVIGGSGDFNGDGEEDILWRNYQTGDNGVWFMDYDPLTGAYNRLASVTIDPQSNTAWYIAGTADLNQDNNLDILWRNNETGDNGVWFMDGTSGGTDSDALERLATEVIESQRNTDWVLANNVGNQNIIQGAFASVGLRVGPDIDDDLLNMGSSDLV